jgi:hypothetical protein
MGLTSSTAKPSNHLTVFKTDLKKLMRLNSQIVGSRRRLVIVFDFPLLTNTEGKETTMILVCEFLLMVVAGLTIIGTNRLINHLWKRHKLSKRAGAGMADGNHRQPTPPIPR